MWCRLGNGQWLPRESVSKMSEVMSEPGESADGMTFQVGDSVTAFTYPLTEGLIIGKAITEEGRLELTLIVAPHKKREKAWSRAAVITRDAARLSKKMPVHFNFPIKNVESLRAEAKKTKGETAWAFATCVALDRDFCGDSSGSEALDSEDRDEKEPLLKNNRALSSPAPLSESETLENKKEQLESRVEEVIHFKDRTFPKERRTKGKKGGSSSDCDFVMERKAQKASKRRKKRKASKKKRCSSSSDSSSSSSSSTSDSSRTSGEVGEKGRSGKFTCPFDDADSRGFRDVKRQIKGQTVVRKQVRIALHDLYAEHQIMTIFAASLVSQANSSGQKPFSTDSAWLQAYARNIDVLLLGSLQGPWALWDEPVLDEMVVGFLDLVVRVSPNKEYPICLEDSVRKWMRKKRMGTNPKYGPVSYAMQHAKFTDSGPLIFQPSWQKPRERSFGKTAFTASPIKGSAFPQGGSDKKPPPAGQA